MLKKLQKGDLIDIVTPASWVTFAEIGRIKEYLHEKGFEARCFLEEEIAVESELSSKFAPTSGKLRYEQLKMAIDASDSAAIWCTNGGYGSADLLEYLAQDKKITQTKHFIGYSDITALATFLRQNWGWETIYGPMLRQLSQSKLHQQSDDAIFGLICDNDFSFCHKFNLTHFHGKNEVSGELVGGCVSLIANNLATNNQLSWDGKILFLEDIEEKGEKLDRIFEQFLKIMIQNNSFPKAILFGNFLQFIEDENLIKNVEIAVVKFITNIKQRGLDIALFVDGSGFLGHSDAILPLVIGRQITIRSKILLQK